MRKILNRVFFLLLLLLGSFTLTSFIASSFKLSYSGEFYLWAGIICIFVWLCFCIRHMRFPGFLLCCAALFFACRRNYSALITQLRDFADKISGQYLDHFYYSAEVYSFSNLTDDHTLTLLLLFTAICFLLAVALSAENGRIFSSLLISGTLFAVCICVNGFPPVFTSVAFMLFVTLILVSGGGYSDSSRGSQAALITALPLLLLLCFLLRFSPPEEYALSDTDVEMAQKLDALGQRITSLLSGRHLDGAPDGSGDPSPEPSGSILNDILPASGWSMDDGTLDLSKAYPDVDRSQLMMRVRADQSGYMYLRCFSYGAYLGTGWSAAERYDSGDPLGFAAFAIENAGGASTHGVDIELIATGKEVLPLPYYSAQSTGNDVFVSSSGVSAYHAEYTGFSGDISSARIPDSYAQAEADYRSYVYNYYTALPESTRDAILSIAAEAGIFPGGNNLTGRVAAYVQGAAEYDLTVSGFDSGDYAVYFLRDAKRGYCTHFATAAAVMYRALGIPARVVDGFAVDAKAGEYVDVYRSDEHSWVEIYMDAVGWIPVEVTGSTPQSSAPAETESPQDDASETDADAAVTPALPDSAVPSQDIVPVGIISTETAENTASSSNSGAADKLGSVIAAVLTPLAVITVWQLAMLHEHKRRFTQKNQNRAALYIYKCAKALSRFGAKIPREIVSAAEKARFSQKGVSCDERLAAYALFVGMCDELCSGNHIFRRLFVRYILCFRHL